MYINYTITTPFIDIQPSSTLPNTYTKVITPKPGFVVSASDFDIDIDANFSLSDYGPINVTFTDTTTPYSIDNKVNVVFTLPSIPTLANSSANSGLVDLTSYTNAGTSGFNIPIKGNAIKAKNSWSGLVSIQQNANDTTSISSPGSVSDVINAGYNTKAITAAITVGQPTEIFSVQFTANQSGGGVVPNPLTNLIISSGYYYYQGNVGFDIQSQNIERYSTSRSNIVYDPDFPNRIIGFTLTVSCEASRTIDFFDFEKFTSSRTLSAPGFISNSAPVATPIGATLL